MNIFVAALCPTCFSKVNISHYLSIFPCFLIRLSSSSSSSCQATSTNIPGPLSPLLPIVHRLRHDLQGYIPYPHRDAVCMFELVVLLLLGRIWGSIELYHLSARPASLVRLTWIVFVMGGRWPYSWCFEGCCLQDLFTITHSILV